MKRAIFMSIFLIALLNLAACAHTKNKEIDPTFTLSSVDDPDGDNDNKGVNYFPLTWPSKGKKVFVFDPNFNDEAGNRLNTGRASGGKTYCEDVNRECRTIVGEFVVFSKGNVDCISNKYPIETNGGAPMPYCMRFHSGGYAIHGSNDVPDKNASHGCIRVTPTAAKWLNKNIVSIGTKVVVLQYKDAKDFTDSYK